MAVDHQRAYFDFHIKVPGDATKAMNFVGLKSQEQVLETKYGSFYFSESQYNDSTFDEVRGYCEIPDLQGFITTITRMMKQSKIGATFTRAGHVNYVITTSDLMGCNLTPKEIGYLSSQGFVKDASGKMFLDTKKKRDHLPIVANEKGEDVVVIPQPKIKRQSLTTIVDNCLLERPHTKDEIISVAAKIYTEKTTQQLRVTITSLISTSIHRTGKAMVYGVKGSEKTYGLQ